MSKRCVSHVVTLLTVSSLSKELFLLILEEIYVEMTPRPNAPDPSRNGDRSGPIDKSEAGQVSDMVPYSDAHYRLVLVPYPTLQYICLPYPRPTPFVIVSDKGYCKII